VGDDQAQPSDTGAKTTDPSAGRRDVLLACLAHEWTDHIQTRVQTWKTLEIEAVLAVGLVSVDVKLQNRASTAAAAVLLMIAAAFGALITVRHRSVEIGKFTAIIRIEQELGVIGPGNIFDGVAVPGPIKLTDVLRVRLSNTALFILRMHLLIFAFGVIYGVSRLVIG
jgi:hypothetical protein